MSRTPYESPRHRPQPRPRPQARRRANPPARSRRATRSTSGGLMRRLVIGASFTVAVAALLVFTISRFTGSSPKNVLSRVERASTTVAAADTTAPQSIKLDARRLLFGKLGKTLALKTKVSPKDADCSTLQFSSSDPAVASISTTGTVTATGWGECTVTASIGDKTTSCQVSVAKKWVAITFDDGPGNPTPTLLDALEKRKVATTFFVIGNQAKTKRGQKLLKRMHKDGFEIGNHTWTHNAAAATLPDELAKTDAAIKKATGSAATLMRPPGGAINDATRACGKAIIMWQVDPRDWRDRNADTVYERVMKQTKSGDIVLLHDIHATSVAAAPRIFDSLKAKGFTFVTVSQLLRNPEANKSYNKGAKTVPTMKIQ